MEGMTKVTTRRWIFVMAKQSTVQRTCTIDMTVFGCAMFKRLGIVVSV